MSLSKPALVSTSSTTGCRGTCAHHPVRSYVEAGFTEVALVQIGDGRQGDVLDLAGKELLASLRAELDR